MAVSKSIDSDAKMTKAIIYETTEIVYSKAEAIKCAKKLRKDVYKGL